MCRFVAYSGEPIFLETQLSDPPRSLISQSREARESLSSVNADGCGVGWYDHREAPGRYRSVRPAWGNANLLSLCEQVRSHLFAGHIRAATSGQVSEANCHPFAVDRHLFLHNGEIGGFNRIRRPVEEMISDKLYAERYGENDSEAIFLIALGRGLDADPGAALASTLTDIVALMEEKGVDEPVHFAAIYTDGKTLYAFRWARRHIGPTLYHREIDTGVVIASEPYDDDHAAWHAVPEDSMITVAPDGSIAVSPFLPRTAPAGAA